MVDRLFSLLHDLGARSGWVPLWAALALALVGRVGALVAPLEVPLPLPAALAKEQLPEDFELIDQVLARRAPGLGLVLRRQVGVAIAQEAKQAGYDPLLVLALIDVESDFVEEAVSSTGARGLMQIQPTTLYFLAQREGIKLSREEVAGDPALCVRLGIRYLRQLNDRFGDLELALMAYNAGPAKIRRVQKAGDLEPFRRYPNAVRRDFRRFRHGVGLAGDWALALRSESEELPKAALR